jgi:cytochrome c oxidase cbb3-type subunit 4
MVVFIGIVIWAYSKRRKTDFDQAGRIAMDDDDNPGNMNSKNKIEE